MFLKIRNISAFVILMALLVIMAHDIIPHHHHDSDAVCVDIVTPDSDENSHDHSCDIKAEDCHHNSSDCSDNGDPLCVYEANFITENTTITNFNFLAIANLFFSIEEDIVEKEETSFIETPPLISDLFQSSFSFRGPPLNA